LNGWDGRPTGRGNGSALGNAGFHLDYGGRTHRYDAVVNHPFLRFTESQNLEALTSLRNNDGNGFLDAPLPLNQFENMEPVADFFCLIKCH